MTLQILHDDAIDKGQNESRLDDEKDFHARGKSEKIRILSLSCDHDTTYHQKIYILNHFSALNSFLTISGI